MIELYKQLKQRTKKGHLRLIVTSIGEGVAKTDDEICVLSTKKIYSYFSFVFSTVPIKGRVVENIKKDLTTMKIVTSIQKSGLIASCCFTEKKTSNFLK